MKLLRTLLLAIFVVAALAYLNIVIPRPQAVQAHTDNFNHSDSCNSSALQVEMQGDACGSFYKTGNDYSTTGKVTNTSNHTITGIQLHFKTYFCDKNDELSSSGSCTNNYKPFDGETFNLAPGESKTFSTPTLHPSDYGNFNSCGLFQNDFWFSYNNGTCTSTLNGSGSGFGFGGVGYCKLWDGHTLKGGSTWSPVWECGQTVTQHHNECQNNACVSVTGAGTNTCSGNADCQPKTHLSCVNNTCTKVSGAGDNSCSTEGTSCGQTDHHYSCVNNACTLVEGAGDNTCTTSPDSCQPTHMACVSHACTKVTGAGDNTCSTDTDCKNDTHLACQNQACVSVAGSGSNSCSQDSDCITPSHHACQNQACVLVSGSGSDSCSQDSDCHVSTCTGQCGDININVEQHQEQQQQQQQAVLGASVAPASTATSLPSTGAGSEVLLGLISLIPAGWKLRKLK